MEQSPNQSETLREDVTTQGPWRCPWAGAKETQAPSPSMLTGI